MSNRSHQPLVGLMTFLQTIVGNEPREPDVSPDHFLIRTGLGVYRLTRTRLLISTDFEHAVIKILVGRNNQIGRCRRTFKYPSGKIKF